MRISFFELDRNNEAALSITANNNSHFSIDELKSTFSKNKSLLIGWLRNHLGYCYIVKKYMWLKIVLTMGKRVL